MRRGLLALFLSALPLGAAQSPSEAALSYLRAVAGGEAGRDLSKETAISKDLTDSRLDEIHDEVGRLKTALEGADFTALATREDGDLAAVLVIQDAGPDSGEMEIRPIGLIRRGDQWLPAPLPSSFDNTGLSFEPARLARARALEEWMMRTRSQQLIDLKETAQKLWQDGVKGAVAKEVLQSGKPEQLVDLLVEAFVRNDQHAVYALLGGADEPLGSDWDNVVKVVRRALNDKKKTSEAWGLITLPQVMRAIVETVSGPHQSTVAMVCQDPGPDRPQRPRVLHFTVVKEDSGLWHVELPELLMVAVKDRREAAQLAKDSLTADAGEIARFPAKLREKYPATPMPDAQAAATGLVDAFREPSLEKALPLLDLSGKDETPQAILARAAALWAGLHSPGDRRSLIPLTFLTAGDEACGIYQFFSSAAAGESQLVRVFLRRSETGWLCSPLMRSDRTPSSDSFGSEVDQAMDRFSTNWAVDRFSRVKAPLPVEGPGEQEAKDLLTRWQAARVNGDVTAMLSMVAGVDDETGVSSVVKNLGYEMAERAPMEIGNVYRDGAWTCVAVKSAGDTPSYGLYPVVATEHGPRILLELYVRATEGKSADYLNRRIFDRAAEAFSEGARATLEGSVQKYRLAISGSDH